MKLLMVVSFGVAFVFAAIYAIDRWLTAVAERKHAERLLAIARLRQHTQPVRASGFADDDDFIRPNGAA